MQVTHRLPHPRFAALWGGSGTGRSSGSARSVRIVALLLTVLAGILLGGCGVNRPLLSDIQADPPLLQPTGAGETTIISYRIGREAVLDMYLESADGQRYDLRRAVPRSPDDDPYTLRFDGTVPVDPAYNDGLLRRLLPDGDYTVVLVARATDGSTSEARTAIAVRSDTPPLPAIENLLAFPETISPNADAIDDVTELTYRLPVTATVDIAITTPDGQVLPFVTRELSSPEERRHVWNGKRPDGAMLPDGVYTYTVRAEDRFGNLVQREGTIRLINVGQPEATIIAARIAPERLMLGGTLTVEMRIRNTGDVPIRTYGPPSGFTYTTDEVYSTIADGRYTAQAGGFWRVGMDWDANSGGGARRYPFRWALSERPPEQWRIPYAEDWLMPGEEVEVVGHVQVVQPETRMYFYVGLIQDGVGFPQDRTARTLIEVGF